MIPGTRNNRIRIRIGFWARLFRAVVNTNLAMIDRIESVSIEHQIE